MACSLHTYGELLIDMRSSHPCNTNNILLTIILLRMLCRANSAVEVYLFSSSFSYYVFVLLQFSVAIV